VSNGCDCPYDYWAHAASPAPLHGPVLCAWCGAQPCATRRPRSVLRSRTVCASRAASLVSFSVRSEHDHAGIRHCGQAADAVLPLENAGPALTRPKSRLIPLRFARHPCGQQTPGQWREMHGHDGVALEPGCGRGHCAGCKQAVRMDGPRWRCECSSGSSSRTRSLAAISARSRPLWTSRRRCT